MCGLFVSEGLPPERNSYSRDSGMQLLYRVPVPAADFRSSFKGRAHVLTTPHRPEIRPVKQVWMPDMLHGENVLGVRMLRAAGILGHQISPVRIFFCTAAKPPSWR